jgi:hypothetical protein
MNGYTSRIHARVLDLSDFDVILGFDWLQTVNPIIDWRALTIQVPGKEGESTSCYRQLQTTMWTPDPLFLPPIQRNRWGSSRPIRRPKFYKTL